MKVTDYQKTLINELVKQRIKEVEALMHRNEPTLEITSLYDLDYKTRC